MKLKPFLVLLDVMETLHAVMKDSFLKMIKIKDLSLKRAVETVLLRCQSFLTQKRDFLSETSKNNLGMEYVDGRIANLMLLMSETAKFPKSYKMIEFVNR